MTCIDEANTMEDMQVCGDALDADGKGGCLQTCNCTKGNEWNALNIFDTSTQLL